MSIRGCERATVQFITWIRYICIMTFSYWYKLWPVKIYLNLYRPLPKNEVLGQKILRGFFVRKYTVKMGDMGRVRVLLEIIVISPLEGCEVLRWACLYVCLSLCLYVCSLAHLKNRTSKFTKFSAHVNCGHGSVIFWRQCNTLCTSGFVDDVMIPIMGHMDGASHIYWQCRRGCRAEASIVKISKAVR